MNSEVAAFPDQARFLRIHDTHQPVYQNYVTLNYSLSLSHSRAAQFFRQQVQQQTGKPGFVVWPGQFLPEQQENRSQGSFEFNPFGAAVTDTALITLSTILANTFPFNRFSTINLSNINNSGKSLRTLWIRKPQTE